jgi:dienelactone hydrolase
LAESPRPRRAGGKRRTAFALLLSCLSCLPLGCAVQGGPPYSDAERPQREIPAELRAEALDPARVRVSPEARTIEQSWILKVYTALHRRDYATFRVELPPEPGDEADAVAHLLVPPGPGPHPALVVFPILAGSHVVSEALAKGLVRRGYLVLRMERHAFPFEDAQHPDELAVALAGAVRGGRRALDWLLTRPDVDPSRVGAAGISMGGMLACLMHASDPRTRAAFVALTGGGIAELLYDTRERPVRGFRDRLIEAHGLGDRAAFLAWAEPHVRRLDPLGYAGRIDPANVFMASGRFDRVVPAARGDALWQALGKPSRLVLPTGHYQALPFLWHVTGRAADHFDRTLGPGGFAEANDATAHDGGAAHAGGDVQHAGSRE